METQSAENYIVKNKYHFSITAVGLDNTLLKTDITQLVDLCGRFKIDSISVLFGFSWGNYIHKWVPQKMKPQNLLDEIATVENNGYGKLGEDDLFIEFIEFPGIMLNYCHHSEIHLNFNKSNEFIDQLIDDWKQKGWIKTNKEGKRNGCG